MQSSFYFLNRKKGLRKNLMKSKVKQSNLRFPVIMEKEQIQFLKENIFSKLKVTGPILDIGDIDASYRAYFLKKDILFATPHKQNHV